MGFYSSQRASIMSIYLVGVNVYSSLELEFIQLLQAAVHAFLVTRIQIHLSRMWVA